MDQNVLDLAISLGRMLQSEADSRVKYRLVAIITDKKGAVLSTGTNSYSKTHPKQKHFASMSSNPNREMLHAEIDAINRLSGVGRKPYAIYVARVNKNGSTGLAKPCDCCVVALSAHRIEKVYHT